MKSLCSVFFFVLFSVICLVSPVIARADFSALSVLDPNPLYANTEKATMTFTAQPGSQFEANKDYTFLTGPSGKQFNTAGVFAAELKAWCGKTGTETNRLIITFSPKNLTQFGTVSVVGATKWELWSGSVFCNNGSPYLVPGTDTRQKVLEGEFTVNPTANSNGTRPALQLDNNEFKPMQDFTITALNVLPDLDYTIWYDDTKRELFSGKFTNIVNGSAQVTASTDLLRKDRKICLTQSGNTDLLGSASAFNFQCDYSVTIKVTDNPVQRGLTTSNATSSAEKTTTAIISFAPVPPPPCQPEKLIAGRCTEVDSALGVGIPTNFGGIIKTLFGLLLGFAGGIALLLIISSGYIIMTSSGNPEAVKGAKESITASIVGIIFILFSLVILQVIGVDILRIPGFGG